MCDNVMTDLSEDTETIVSLVTPAGSYDGNGAGHLSGEHRAHGVPQPPLHTPPVPGGVTIVLHCVPAIAVELAIQEQVRHPELNTEKNVV